MNDNPLGKATEYKASYDASLLFPIPRAVARDQIGIEASLFCGHDIWNCHELGWLNARGKPLVRRLRLVYSADSRCIVESKSLKLYLGSFLMSRFADEAEVQATIERDLAAILDARQLLVALVDWPEPIRQDPIDPSGLIDDLDVACDRYDLDASLLVAEDSAELVEQRLVSNLLKTNCPITNQPDWATVSIRYRGKKTLDKAALLKYLVSYREHGDYHEVCCENIFSDLLTALEPEMLAVKCFFTRRGGIDINPCRFYGMAPDSDFDERYWRQ